MDNLTIPSELAGKRLDDALAQLSGQSRNRIQQLLTSGMVTSASGRLKASRKVKVGELFTLSLPPSTPLTLIPEAIPLDILFEDDHLLVVNKPAGMVVHPSYGHDTGTLVHALLHHCPELPGINGVQRPGIVHRLDKDTSGALVVAKDEATMRALSELFSTHDLERQYVAWCRGRPLWQCHTIELPLARHRHHRQKMAVCHNGKEAITEANCEFRHRLNMSRIRLTLHTGRTHQIRVHLSHLGLPILGDPLYARPFNPSKSFPKALRAAIIALPGQALHAELLAFTHPITKAEIHCVAPRPSVLATLDEVLIDSQC
ncbi:MAG: RluA family pseudouridine synthase [Mariprofundales bacterium]|nr:RluA family pseudouridine synthase [Mariprofundales bacterium]